MFKITKIFIVPRVHGMDQVVLHTDLPPATRHFASNEINTFLFFAAKGFGEEYCKEHFPGVPVEVMED